MLTYVKHLLDNTSHAFITDLNFFKLNLPQKESFAVSLVSYLDSGACMRKMLHTFLVSPYDFKGS